MRAVKSAWGILIRTFDQTSSFRVCESANIKSTHQPSRLSIKDPWNVRARSEAGGDLALDHESQD
jgi:hypothetical protein